MDKVEHAESIVLLAMVDQEEKATEVSTNKRHKKRKKSMTLVEETTKKVKLLASTISVMKTTKVHLAPGLLTGLYALI